MSLDVDIDHARGDFRLKARFSAAPGLTALFGRSGSGKTSLVSIVGGLIRPDRGLVSVDGQTLVDTESSVFVPPHRRRIGYVFQDSRLFPHLNVRRNLLYGRWFARGIGGAAADLGAVLDATVSRHDETFQLSVLQSAAGELQVPRLNAPVGATVRAYIRARDVMLSLQPPQDISALNVLAGRIASITSTATAQADVRLDCNGAVLMARLTSKSVDRLALAPGREVYAVVKSVSFERS